LTPAEASHTVVYNHIQSFDAEVRNAVDDIQVNSQRDGAVKEIVLNRPEKRNALAPHMFERLIEVFEAGPDENERAVLIRGEGRAFCAGVDLSERIQNGWPTESPLVRLCEAIRTYPLPVVAAMHGDAIAGGAMLAMHCDLIIAQEGARLAMPLAQLGIAPPWIMTSRTIDRVGPSLGRDLLLLGNPVPAERLYAHNAVNACVPREAFADEVNRTMARLVANAPLSLRAVKAALALIGDAGGKDGHPDQESYVRAALDSTDAREGMRARLERREPVFQGQ
jgi:enoyl-CoA hydratase/carnithine racemase